MVYLTSEEIFLLTKEMEDGTVESVTADPFGLLGGPTPNEDYVRDGPGTFYTPEDQLHRNVAKPGRHHRHGGHKQRGI